MSRTRVILIVAAVIVIAVLIGLSSINTEVPLTPVEEPVANAALGH
jgi:predicted lipoprotein